MRPTRRAFLKTAAALPVAGAAASVATVAPVPIIEAPWTPALLPAYPFRWYFSYEGEIYHDEFDTKEEALRALAGYGRGLIAECQRQDYDLSLDGNTVLEALEGQNEEAIGEGEFLDSVTNEQVRDLGTMVSDAIDAWVRKHKIDTSAWSFGAVRNQIYAVESPDDPPGEIIRRL